MSAITTRTWWPRSKRQVLGHRQGDALDHRVVRRVHHEGKVALAGPALEDGATSSTAATSGRSSACRSAAESSGTPHAAAGSTSGPITTIVGALNSAAQGRPAGGDGTIGSGRLFARATLRACTRGMTSR
jgi:hypothetical protein